MSDGHGYSGRELHPYEAAYLAGGTRHTLAASLAALGADGVFTVSRRGRFEVAGGIRTVRTPIDLALLDAVQSGRRIIYRIQLDPGVRQAVDDLRRRLDAEGLAAGRSARILRRGKPSTPAGREALRQMRARHSHLNPRYGPAWTTYGPMGVAMGVGLFGPPALRSVDPAFAMAVGWSRHTTGSRGSSSSGGGGGYYDGGGCGSGGDSGGGGGCGGGGG